LSREATEEEEMDNLLKDAVLGEVNDIVATVVEAQTKTHCGDCTIPGDHSLKALFLR
jgi:hypothetical protein